MLQASRCLLICGETEVDPHTALGAGRGLPPHRCSTFRTICASLCHHITLSAQRPPLVNLSAITAPLPPVGYCTRRTGAQTGGQHNAECTATSPSPTLHLATSTPDVAHSRHAGLDKVQSAHEGKARRADSRTRRYKFVRGPAGARRRRRARMVDATSPHTTKQSATSYAGSTESSASRSACKT